VSVMTSFPLSAFAMNGAQAEQARRLHAKLLEVVVDVLVHPHRPFVGREAAEEAVRMVGAAGGPGSGEAVDDGGELGGFSSEIAVVGDLETGNCRGVAAHGLAGLEGFFLNCGTNEAADEHPGRTTIAAGQLHPDGAVGHRLRGRHLSPETRRVGTEAGDSALEFLDRVRLPEGLHGGDDSKSPGCGCGAGPLNQNSFKALPIPSPCCVAKNPVLNGLWKGWACITF